MENLQNSNYYNWYPSTSLGGSITLVAITNGSGIQSGSITNDDLIGSISNDKLGWFNCRIKLIK